MDSVTFVEMVVHEKKKSMIHLFCAMGQGFPHNVDILEGNPDISAVTQMYLAPLSHVFTFLLSKIVALTTSFNSVKPPPLSHRLHQPVCKQCHELSFKISCNIKIETKNKCTRKLKEPFEQTLIILSARLLLLQLSLVTLDTKNNIYYIHI